MRKYLYTNIPIIMNRKELQEILHISKATAINLLKNKRIDSFMVGNSYRITREALEEYIQNNMYL